MNNNQVDTSKKILQTRVLRGSLFAVMALALLAWLVFGGTNKDSDISSGGNELVPEGGLDVSATPRVSDGFISFGYRVPGFDIDVEVTLSHPGFVVAYLDTGDGQQVNPSSLSNLNLRQRDKVVGHAPLTPQHRPDLALGPSHDQMPHQASFRSFHS